MENKGDSQKEITKNKCILPIFAFLAIKQEELLLGGKENKS
jgi:hypothetical protein